LLRRRSVFYRLYSPAEWQRYREGKSDKIMFTGRFSGKGAMANALNAVKRWIDEKETVSTAP
jgi:phosphopantetheinyl transferase (holo-ACP synthase)